MCSLNVRQFRASDFIFLKSVMGKKFRGNRSFLKKKILPIIVFLSVLSFTSVCVSQSSNSEEIFSDNLPVHQSHLCNIGSNFTLKVFNEDFWGSGVIVSRDGNRYSAVTNAHVLQEGQELFDIQTIDGVIHHARLMAKFDHGPMTGNDLAFFRFDSSNNYAIARFGQLDTESDVIAIGFPHFLPNEDPNSRQIEINKNREPFCTNSTDSPFLLPEPMQQGYQIGTLLNIHAGMSGGPLVNEEGLVIGINGMTQPLIVNPDIYLYRDGEYVVDSLLGSPTEALDFLSSRSWTIPSELVVYYSPSGINLSTIPVD